MKIAAALSWWNERPEDLVDCVRGIAQVADAVVALDGAYRRYPGATARSSDAEVAAIRDTAAEMGLDCLILQPERTWTGEIEKRSALLALASMASDWVVIVDTDHVISADRDAVRAELAATTADIVAIWITTPQDPGRRLEDTAATNWHRQTSERGLLSHPLILRSYPGMCVERHHWWYRAEKNGVRTWLAMTADDSYPKGEEAILQARYLVEHRCLFRSPEQMLAARGWYNDRVKVVAATGQEDAVPGLPDPEPYDHTTVPF